MNQVLRALLLTILVALVLSGGLWLLRGDAAGLRRPADAYFKAWYAGGLVAPAQAKAFEGEANKLVDIKMRDFYYEQLGEFVEAGPTLDETASHDRGYITMNLVFERGEGQGHFWFVHEEGHWRVQRFRLDLPRSAAKGLPFEDPRRFAGGLLENWAQGEAALVYEQFALELRKRLPEKPFVKATKAFVDERGEVAEVIERFFEDKGGDTAKGDFEVVFQESKHKAHIELIWEGGRWYFDRFEIEGFQ